MEFDVRIQEDGGHIKLEVIHARAIHQVRDALDDIADFIEKEATVLAPLGETGELKAHAVERGDTLVGHAEANLPSFGGGFAVRGPGGRFIAGGLGAGTVVSHIELSIPEEPKHARWVHQGTGIYGPRRSPIVPRTQPYMIFRIDTRWFRMKSVRGQTPQPYLTEAYIVANRTFIPYRIERLREQIASDS